MKKFLIIFMLIFGTFVSAEEAVQTTQATQPKAATTPQNIMFEDCTKIYGINQENLFYLTLASITANRFKIDEIQTDRGYIIFTANRNKYLASVAKIDNSNSILKITPCNNIYNFPLGIITNTFKYIDLKMTTGNS